MTVLEGRLNDQPQKRALSQGEIRETLERIQASHVRIEYCPIDDELHSFVGLISSGMPLKTQNAKKELALAMFDEAWDRLGKRIPTMPNRVAYGPYVIGHYHDQQFNASIVHMLDCVFGYTFAPRTHAGRAGTLLYPHPVESLQFTWQER